MQYIPENLILSKRVLMLEINIPGFKIVELNHLVLDYNGTLAFDGDPVSGVKEVLQELSEHLEIHIITADTFGKVASTFAQDPCIIKILPQEDQAWGKLHYVRELNSENCVCMGNGRNDSLMLQEAGLGIAVSLNEGLSRDAAFNADILINGILPALQLLQNPLRLKATLRS